MDRLNTFMEPFVEAYRMKAQRNHAVHYVSGLCSDLHRKNGESIAYHFGQSRKGIQHFIGESEWNDEPLRDELTRQIGDELGEADGVLAFDPSSFPKSGQQSVGVVRQWCGRLGKIDNCQVGVYLAYVSSKGHTLVDTDLYLPREWTNDKARMRRAGVPRGRQRHRTRHEICLQLLDRHGDQLPHSWITGDDEMGRPAGFRSELRERNERYLLAVPCNTTIRDLEIPPPEHFGPGRPPKRKSCRVDRWIAERSPDEWTNIEVRDGEKGPLKVEALKREVETGKRGRPSVATEVLVVIRYRDRDSAIVKTDYYLSNALQSTPLSEFCRAAKAAHRVEECLRRAKSEVGLADYEVRNWRGWQHHQTLSLLATWFVTVETRRLEKKDTGDHVQSGPDRYRIHSAYHSSMRFSPRHQLENRAAFGSQPTRTALPLEKTQPASTKKLTPTTVLGQSN